MRSPDAEITINGVATPLRLTLGALATIETALGGDAETLSERLKKPRVSDILLILHALIGGGGGALTLEALKASDIDIAEAARAVAKAFSTLGEEGDDAPGKAGAGEGR